MAFQGRRFGSGRLSATAAAVVLAALMLATVEPADASGGRSDGAGANSGAERLSGERLKRFLAGKRIYLAVPLGGELPLFYRADGHVDGSGQAAGLGRFLAPTDSGRWWVDGERVCQKWRSWYDGRTFCFTLDLLPGEKVSWHRDDGEKGVARFGP